LKGNAYGHGAIPIARFLLKNGVERICVSTVEEGKELRNAGVPGPIVLIGERLILTRHNIQCVL
jgi:alanine racemase